MGSKNFIVKYITFYTLEIGRERNGERERKMKKETGMKRKKGRR